MILWAAPLGAIGIVDAGDAMHKFMKYNATVENVLTLLHNTSHLIKFKTQKSDLIFNMCNTYCYIC
jgi:hypothetical protein